MAKLGKWAEAVYRFVCWQKFSFDDAYDFLRIDGLYRGSYIEFIKEIEPIKKAPCRENPAFQSIDETSESALNNINAESSNPLEFLIQRLDREKRIKAIKVIRETTVEFSEDDQLLVRLVYGSDQSVAAAAKVMRPSGIDCQKTPGKSFDKIPGKIAGGTVFANLNVRLIR